MINIEYDSRHLTITGHAGYDEPGKDIVCAAVSALWYSLIAKMIDDESKGLINFEFDADEKSEKKYINIHYVNPNHKDYFREYWHCITNGLSIIALEYSKYVKIIN